MYNDQEVAERIKKTARSNKIKMENMLIDCGLGINAISHLAKGQKLAYSSLAKIAEYLNCSMDYLVGRTDEPKINTK